MMALAFMKMLADSYRGDDGNIVLLVLFWILYILWAIAGCFPLEGPYRRGHFVIGFVLIGILGLRVFHNPLNG